MQKQLSPETAPDQADVAARLALQEQRIARLEREMGAVHVVVAVLKADVNRANDPHRRRLLGEERK